MAERGHSGLDLLLCDVMMPGEHRVPMHSRQAAALAATMRNVCVNLTLAGALVLEAK